MNAPASDFDSKLLSAAASDALSSLSKVGAKAPQLVEAWVKSGNAAAVSEAAERADGAARKAARRGLNVLKARGIAVPEQARVSAVAGPRAPSRPKLSCSRPTAWGTCFWR